MTYTYVVSWYGSKQVKTPSIYPGVSNTELSYQIGSNIFMLPHPVCEHDYYDWQEEIQEINELYKLPAIIAISEIGGIQ